MRRFRRNRRGSAAVEFALVAPVFFALLFAIIEAAHHVLRQPGARDRHPGFRASILTGQAQNAGYTQAQFRRPSVCSRSLASVLFTCANVYVDVESYSAFANVSHQHRSTAAAISINNIRYSPGGPGDIVVVQMFYQWPLFVTGLGYNISNLSGNKRLLAATAAFRNEPYRRCQQ